MSIEARLAELGVTLPDAPAPAANYVPFVITGNLCHVSGQISADANGQIKGKLGADFTVEQGAAAAKACAISLLAQAKKAFGMGLLFRPPLISSRACVTPLKPKIYTFWTQTWCVN